MEEIHVVEEVVEVVEVVERGEQGPPGASGDSTTTKTAAEIIGVYEAVRLTTSGTVEVCDPAVEADIDTLLGVATQSVSATVPLVVRVHGEITDLGWAWTPGGPLYLGVGGALTQTLPAEGTVAALVRMGFAITATVIRIDIQRPIYL